MNTQDIYKTTVIFRKYPDGDILALMPYDIANGEGNCTSYMHVGQHGAAHYEHCISQTKPAVYAEYKNLVDELISLGYNLEIRRKANGRKQSEAFLESIRMRGAK